MYPPPPPPPTAGWRWCVLALFAALSLADCGGGGSGSTEAPSAVEPVQPVSPVSPVPSDPPAPPPANVCRLVSAGAVAIGSYKFIGESQQDRAGWSLSPAGDIDEDGCADLILGAPNHPGGDSVGAVYVVAAADLAAADAADGATDGEIGLGHLQAQPNSWKLLGENANDRTGGRLISTSLAGADNINVLIGADGHDTGRSEDTGAVYLAALADLPAADAADGVTDRQAALARVVAQPGSWKFLGENFLDHAGWSLASAGRFGEAGRAYLIGAPYPHNLDRGIAGDNGAVYAVAPDDLAGADAADGAVDGVIELRHIAAQAASWKLLGGSGFGRAGWSVTALDNRDGGRRAQFVIGEPYDLAGAVHVFALAGLAAGDALDGEVDGSVELARTVTPVDAWKLLGENESARTSWSLSSVGDVDGDGLGDLLVGAPGPDAGANTAGADTAGAAYLIAAADLPAADAADGVTDGSVGLGYIFAQAGSWKLVGENAQDRAGWSLSSAGDIDGDGRTGLFISAPDHADAAGAAYVVAAADLAAADAADGAADGIVELARAATWKFVGENPGDRVGWSLSSVGDVDGDGRTDLVIGAVGNDAGGTDAGAAYLFLHHDLAAADAGDGSADRVISLSSFGVDSDADGYRDGRDAFPEDPAEWVDTDSDGVGDNAQQDSPPRGLLLSGAGSVLLREYDEVAAVYTAALKSKPDGDVLVAITSVDSGAVRVASAQLRFTPDNWNRAQGVRLGPVEDADGDDESVAIVHKIQSAADPAYDTLADIVVTVKVDDDEAAILIMATVNHFMLSQLSKLARLEAEMSRNIDFYALLALEMAGITFVAFDQQP